MTFFDAFAGKLFRMENWVSRFGRFDSVRSEAMYLFNARNFFGRQKNKLKV
jgi:hypothetical protein